MSCGGVITALLLCGGGRKGELIIPGPLEFTLCVFRLGLCVMNVESHEKKIAGHHNRMECCNYKYLKYLEDRAFYSRTFLYKTIILIESE